jgi:amino acid adenylation domain-containing protein
MQLLLTMNLPYTRAHGGANRSNRFLAEALAARGHVVRAVVPALPAPSPLTLEQARRQLAEEGVELRTAHGVDRFTLAGVEVHAVADPARLRAYLGEQIRALAPDFTLVSSEDPSQSLLEAALGAAPARVVYLAHTPQMFPFGPESLYPGEARTALIGQAAAIVTVSRFVADYIHRHAGFAAFTNHPPHYGPAPFPLLGGHDNPFVLLMNASPIKGLPIFLALARQLPEVRFATVAGYATAAEDLAALAALPNVTLLANRRDLDDVLRTTRLLLMPSLWAEGFGMAAVDAMLRGIPVLAADHGGLPEALMGAGRLLPVRPIEGFEDRLGGNLLPVPVIPPQDAAPWRQALLELVADRRLYERQSQAAREAANRFVAGLGIGPFEELLAGLLERPAAGVGGAHAARAAGGDGAARAVAAAGTANAPGTANTSGTAADLAGLGPDHLALLIARLRRAAAGTGGNGGNDGSAAAGGGRPPLLRVSRGGDLPLSFGQQRLWFLQQLDPASYAYNMSAALRMEGELHAGALAAAFAELVRRHEALRTTFPDRDGKPVQAIAAAGPHAVPLVDLSLLPAPRRDEETVRLARLDAARPFDLGRGPLLRTTLLRLAARDHAVVFNLHHIVGDGWSMGVLQREILALYGAFSRGAASPLPALPLQYADYAAWQRRWLAGPVLEEKLDYWRRRLAGAPPVLPLPFDRPRPAAQSYQGANRTLAIEGPLHQALVELAHRQGATLFMTVLAAFQALLHRYTAAPAIVVGTPIAGRDSPELEGLVGFFVNTLVLRADLGGALTFREILGQVREGALAAFAHQEVPFEKVVEALRPERSASLNPLFQVMFAFQEAGRAAPPSVDLVLGGIRRGLGRTLVDLMLSGSASEERLLLAVTYSTELFDEETIAALCGHLRDLLTAVAGNPDMALAEVPLAVATEPQRRLAGWAAAARLAQASPAAGAAAAPPAGAAPAGQRRQVAALAAEVSLRRANLSAAKQGLLERRWQGRAPGAARAAAIPRRGGSGPAPLSFAQQRLWFLWQLEPGSPAYNVPAARRLHGPLRFAALEAALREIIRRHEVLRTRFAIGAGGEAVQIAVAQLAFSIPRIDLAALPAAAREAEARRQADAAARREMDLARLPLLRVSLLRLGEDDHVAVVVLHHIVADGWSAGIFVRELLALYNAFRAGAPSPLAELPLQYADFACWQRQREHLLEEHLAYWKRQLGGELPVLRMPTDRPRSALRTSRGATVSAVLPQDVGAAAQELSRRRELTLFVTLLAAFQTVLHRYTGQDDLLIGNPTANRSHAELEELIGFFVNTLVLRCDLAGEPAFGELLRRVREVVLGAQSHQDLPFEKLVEELRPERDPSRSPLFQVMFVLQTAPRQLPAPRTGLRMAPLDVEGGTAQFDLVFIVSEAGGQQTCHCKYNTDLFDRSTMLRLLGHFARLLRGAVADPGRRVSELPLLSAPERHQLRAEWNDVATSYPRHRCVHQLFEEWADAAPGAVALAAAGAPGGTGAPDGAGGTGDALTYGEMERRANLLANHLRGLGVGPGVLVGLCLERSLDRIVALLAVLKAGGAYVPLDPEVPLERLSFMLQDSGLSVLLAHERLADRLPSLWIPLVHLDAEWDVIAQGDSGRPDLRSVPESPAYLMYTSGSTGAPKAVTVTHRAIVRLVRETGYFTAAPGDAFLALAPVSFDASTFEVWGALLNGARLVVPPPGQQTLAELGAIVRESAITVLWLTAGLFHLMAGERLADLRPLRRLLAGGDVLAPEPVERCLAALPETVLVNGYGPTESTTFAVCHPMRGRRGGGVSVPLGRPIANTRVLLLGRYLELVPAGVLGELAIGGDGLAQGYHGRPALTAERFVPDAAGAAPGARLYRTGDLGRQLADGTIEFAGRADDQVKIRGFRVEPGEVAAALARHRGVRDCVVAALDDARGDKRLVAYFVPASKPAPAAGELQEHLRGRLPEFMVPAAFVALDSLPLGANGKVDRRRLPPPGEPAAAAAPGAPRTPVEEVTAEIWAQVLRLPAVGIHDDFFGLGGHSLLGTQVVSRMRDSFGVDVSLRSLFETPTVAGVAAAVEAALRQEASAQAPPLRRMPRQGGVPLSFAQQRLWFLHQLAPESPLYNVPAPLRLAGDLDEAVLAAVLGEIVRRHEVLRTTFAAVAGQPGQPGQPLQVVAPWRPFALPRIDLSGLAAPARRAEARRLTALEVRRPFDLARGPLLRVRLLRLAAADRILIFNMHHIVSDGWSIGVLLREVKALYRAVSRGEPSPLAELPVQYADFSLWQREWLQGAALEAQLGYWRRQLAGVPELRLPADRPRPAVPSRRGSSHAATVPAELTARLLQLGRGEGVTLFMTMLAAFATFLYRTCGQTDVVVGTPIANRNRAEVEGLVGFFVNTLALRVRAAPAMTFRELLHRVREGALGAYVHQDLPFEKLVEELHPGRNLRQNPIFQVAFAVQNAPAEELDLPGLEIEVLGEGTGLVHFDLVLSVRESHGLLHLSLGYSTDLFAPASARGLLQRLCNLLEQAAAEPDRELASYRLLDESETAGLRPEDFPEVELSQKGLEDLILEISGRAG